MAVDKGSLDYKIRVTDQFTKPILKFRTELLKARNTANQVKQDLAGVTAAIGRLGATTARAGVQTAKLTTQEKAHWKAVREGAKTAATAERLRARARKDQGAEAARQAKETARVARDTEKATNKAAKAKIAADKAAASASKRAVAEQKRLNRELNKTSKRANGLVLTFKRLAGVFIGFQAIRFGAEAIRSSITAGIRFNSVIEDARIGMAGLFATLQNVRDIQSGKLLTGAEGFAGALSIADETLEKIRQRSLATAATFPELAAAFRAGFAPGISAGLNTEQIIEVTERVSQVLTGLGIAQNQINEEIRSLLLGTATSRTSLVATLFFGGAANSNQAIKEAKRMGNVFPVITENLKAFKIAAEESQKSFTGTVARVKGLLEVVAGRASLGFFQSLKDILGDIQELAGAATRETSGFITSIKESASAIAVLRIVFTALENVTNQARAFIAGLTTAEIVSFLLTVGAMVEVFAALLFGAFDGVIRAVALLGSLVNALGFAMSGLDLSSFTELISILTTIAVLAVVVKTSILGWGIGIKIATALAGPFTIALRAAQFAVGNTLKLIGLIPGGLFRAAGVVGILGLAFLEVTRAVTGIDLALGQLPEAMGALIESIATKTIGLAKIIASQIKNAIIIIFAEINNALANFFEDVNEGLALFRGDAGRQQLVIDNEAAKIARLTKLDEIRKDAAKRINDLKMAAARIDTDADTKRDARLGALSAEVEKRKALVAETKRLAKAADEVAGKQAGFLDNILGSLSGTITALIGDDIVDAQGITTAIVEAFEKARAELASKPPIVDERTLGGVISKGFEKMADDYDNALAIMKGLTQQFSSFASQEIVTALDPNENEDGPSANERFKAFLDQIGKMIIQKLVELAIAKAIFSIAGGAADGGSAGAAHGGQIGFDDGGTVPGGKHEAKQFRPAQVAMSDTVPAWLTPGEFVTPVRSVMKYGADLLEGIRTGAIDAAALREAAGLTNRRKSVKKIRARGFAEGGAVDTATSGAKELQRQQNQTGFAGGQQVTPALVADDQTMERIMAGGQRAFRNWAENDKEFFRGIVRE